MAFVSWIHVDMNTNIRWLASGLRSAFVCFCILLVVLPDIARGFKFKIPRGETQCIDEALSSEQVEHRAHETLSIDGALQVINANNNQLNYNSRRSVDVTVSDSSGTVLFRRDRVWQEVKFSVQNSGLGNYRLCLHSGGLSKSDVTVDLAFFTISHVSIGDSDDGIVAPKGTKEQRSAELASHLHLTTVHDSVLRLHELLQLVQGEQAYYSKRLVRHVQTTQDIYRRTMVYPAVEMVTLALLAILQVTIIHKLFQHRKRIGGILGL